MLRIRLRRVGAKNQPSYRIVVADSRAARDGAFVDHLGHYDPRPDPPTIVVDREKALHWISRGAQPSEAVQRILNRVPEPTPEATPEPTPEPTPGPAENEDR